MNAKKRLKNAIKNDRVAHSYLFIGPNTKTKKKVAEWFVGRIFENDVEENEKALKFDVNRLKPEEKKRPEIKIDDIRQLKKFLGTSPVYGSWKGAIVDGAETMNKQAANAFLKILEEPQDNRVIVLLATNPRVLPDTVVSRCVGVKFERRKGKDIDQDWEKFEKLLDEDLNGCFKRAEEWSKLESEELISILENWLLYLRKKVLLQSRRSAQFLKFLRKTITLLKSTNVNRRLALERLMIEYVDAKEGNE